MKDFIERLCSYAFKSFKETCPLYLHDIYRQSCKNQANTRSFVLKVKHLLRNTCSGQINSSYLTPIVWNSLLKDLKSENSLNNFKHKLKSHFVRKMEKDIFTYWRHIRNPDCNICNKFSISLMLIFSNKCFMLIFSNRVSIVLVFIWKS